ncbi:MAG: hypothetical protein KatS3mg062_1050 [Tepidiforma sp.]|nr:MAG: hypothetical protein KatS3mg062_1050 [Tepidiforma sp.]
MRTAAAFPIRLIRRAVRIAIVTAVVIAIYAALDALLLPGEPRGRPAA